MTVQLPFASTTAPARSPWIKRLEIPLTGLFWTLALGLTAATLPAKASEAETSPPALTPVVFAQSTPTAPIAAPIPASSLTSGIPFADGVYLYGQSPLPDQLDTAYIVFQVRDRTVVGAFYMPYSAFDCFYGEVRPSELVLTVMNSEEQASYPYSISWENSTTVAATSGAAPTVVNLVGYDPIEAIAPINYEILATCTANYQI